MEDEKQYNLKGRLSRKERSHYAGEGLGLQNIAGISGNYKNIHNGSYSWLDTAGTFQNPNSQLHPRLIELGLWGSWRLGAQT